MICENFKVCIEHCGDSLERIVITYYNLSGESVKVLKKLGNLYSDFQNIPRGVEIFLTAGGRQ